MDVVPVQPLADPSLGRVPARGQRPAQDKVAVGGISMPANLRAALAYAAWRSEEVEPPLAS